jgi:hypothetical protein
LKFVHKLFVFITILVFLLLDTYKHPISAGIYKPLVVVNNITTVPDPLHVGDSFDLNMTISNLHSYDIQVLSFGCKGPVNIIFDDFVKVNSTGSGMCTNFEPIINIKPNESRILLSPDVTLYYKTTKPGIVMAKFNWSITKSKMMSMN